MEIPVKKTSGVPWWVWLLAALLLIGLIWWLLAALDDDAEVEDRAVIEPAPVVGAPGVVDPVGVDPNAAPPAVGVTDPAATGPITDLTTVLSASDPASLAGREFRLEGVRVLSVVGDRTFWVGESEQRRVFAAMLEDPTSAGPSDAAININAGQTVRMSGVVRSPNDQALGGRQLEGMPAGTPIVLYAQQAEVATRP